jgi:hypothetical protein
VAPKAPLQRSLALSAKALRADCTVRGTLPPQGCHSSPHQGIRQTPDLCGIGSLEWFLDSFPECFLYIQNKSIYRIHRISRPFDRIMLPSAMEGSRVEIRNVAKKSAEVSSSRQEVKIRKDVAKESAEVSSSRQEVKITNDAEKSAEVSSSHQESKSEKTPRNRPRFHPLIQSQHLKRRQEIGRGFILSSIGPNQKRRRGISRVFLLSSIGPNQKRRRGISRVFLLSARGRNLKRRREIGRGLILSSRGQNQKRRREIGRGLILSSRVKNQK